MEQIYNRATSFCCGYLSIYLSINKVKVRIIDQYILKLLKVYSLETKKL